MGQYSYEDHIHLKYKQPVNGYKVEVAFLPQEAIYDKISGWATLRFKNQTTGEEHRIGTSYFAVSWRNFPDIFKNQDQLLSMAENEELGLIAKGQTYNLDYKFFENPGMTDKEFILSHPFFYGEYPFFFADVNFDGKDELLLTNFGQGQRGCSSYTVFSIAPDGSFQLMTEAPFDRLDDFSTIDRENKQIILPAHNSAEDYSETVYRLSEL